MRIKKTTLIIAGALLCSLANANTNEELYAKNFKQACEFVKSGNLEAAKTLFDKALEYKPDDFKALEGSMRAHALLKTESAAKSVEQEIANNPNPVAERTFKEKKEGIRFGAYAVQNSFGGDLDDFIFLTNKDNSEGLILDGIDAGYGFGVLVGFDCKPGFLDLSFEHSTHKANSFGGENDASFSALNTSYKHFIRTEPGKINPFISGGIGVVWLKVENLTANIDLNIPAYWNESEQTLSGWSVQAGCGVEFEITPAFSIETALGYRWMELNSVDDATIDEGLTSYAPYVSAGLLYNF